MKFSAIILSICLTLFLWSGGCSKEEPPPHPEKKQKVVMPIIKPTPEMGEMLLHSKQENSAKEETKEATELTKAAIKEKTIKSPETDSMEKEMSVKEVPRYYIIKKGDSLSSISGRSDVYGDLLKWPILYRLNMDKLDTLQLREGFLKSELPEGVRLKIITSDEAKENVKRRLRNVWAVNVLSAKTNDNVIPAAIRLIENGHHVYITSATIKGKDWIRLRVGFFKNRADANTEAKKIMALLRLDNSWVTKTVNELNEFGGY